jgi:hypothetical protein
MCRFRNKGSGTSQPGSRISFVPFSSSPDERGEKPRGYLPHAPQG